MGCHHVRRAHRKLAGRRGGPGAALLVFEFLRPKFRRWHMDPGRASARLDRDPPRKTRPIGALHGIFGRFDLVGNPSCRKSAPNSQKIFG